MKGETLAAARPEVDAFELAGTGMLVTDESGLILRANRAYCELLGRREDELAGHPFFHAFPKPAQALARRALKAALEPDALPMPSHWTLVRRDGRSVAVLLTARATGGEHTLAVITITDVTAMAAIEQRLTAVLDEQRLILDHAQVGILFSRSGRVMRVNAACARMFGYPERDLVGQPTTVLVAAIDGTEPPGGEPWHAELEVSRRDGTAFWCEIDGQPFSAAGDPVQSIWTLRDVTGRRRAQEDLARVLIDQRALLDNASVGIVFTRDRTVLRLNRKAEELCGWEPGELVGRPGLVFYPDEAAYAALGAEAGPVLARGEAFLTELELRRKDGTRFWARLAAKAVNPRATGDGTIWIIEDITETRRAAESLNRLLRELSTILDTATVGIAYSRNRMLLRCNRKLEELFGYAPGELVGRSSALLYPSDDAFERFGADAFPVIEGGGTYEAEVPHIRRDGTPILCHVSGRAIDPADIAQGLIWIVQDVTAQHAAQEALVRARDQLEQRVAERTRDLAEKNDELETEIADRRLAEEQLRVRGERLLYHRNQLLALARRDRSDLDHALKEMLEVACTTLRLDRASYWRMVADGSAIRCELVHRADGAVDPAPAADTLEAADHPAYFGAIVANEIVAAEDAASHPATRSLAPVYHRPLGIAATLDAPVWLDGRVVGMVCGEVTRGTRAWQPEEIDFASGIATMIALALEASQRRGAEAQLMRLAHYDSLTGLPNRNLLADRLRQALVYASRHRSRVALMFLDLDRFKNINDSLGHYVGDQILKEVAARLTRTLRAGDTVARLGGDEFVVVLQEVRDPADAATVAQNLLRELGPPYLVEGRELHLSASAGITLYPDDGRDADVLMKNADVAMYHVKDSGRNGFQFFAATMNHAANRRLAIENDLRLAIRRDELVLHYQPQVDLARRAVRAVESLVRWRHPERGLVMPGGFIGIAEECGLAQPLGEWTLHEACVQSRRWQAAGIAPVPVAVNLSARVFRERSFVTTLRSILDETRLDPTLLELEITESAVMQQSDATSATLEELSAMGIQLAVDDFGTGYSSLAYLKRFPIDKLKIDRSFVRGIPTSGDDTAITRAIVSLARSLGLRVVAEGVETDAQLGFLSAHGCDDVQGNFFCPPLDARETERIFGCAQAAVRQAPPPGEPRAL
jgi:diguanylate cyclase (GGDEF)-like protein/PAS domain S-box-containing protein